MSQFDVSFLGLILAFAAAAVLVVGKEHGFRFVARGMGRELQSIRSFDVLGCGVRLLGVRAAPRPDQHAATFWVTAFFVPLFPLGRRVVRFVDPGLSEARWVTLETTPIEAREVARTYLFGWILFPLLLVGPFLIGSWAPKLAAWLGPILGLSRDLADVARLGAGLLGGLFVLLGIPWFAIAVYRLRRWDQDRRRPTP